MTELLKFVTDSENGFTFGQMTAIVVVAAALSIMYKRITSNNQSPLNRACQYLESVSYTHLTLPTKRIV